MLDFNTKGINKNNPFEKLLKEINIEFEPAIQTFEKQDENISSNRVFQWKFDKNDLQEYVNYFLDFNEIPTTPNSRSSLQSSLLRKSKEMLRRGYIPIECMLYASKIINNKIDNDKTTRMMLSDVIKDSYSEKTEDTERTLIHMLKNWDWVPQLKIIIIAVGKIGGLEELEEMIYDEYKNRQYLIYEVFYALHLNPTIDNLKRIIYMIDRMCSIKPNTQSEENMVNTIKREFYDTFYRYGNEGSEILSQYTKESSVSFDCKKFFLKILAKYKSRTGEAKTGEYDSVNYYELGKFASNDNEAYAKFLDYYINDSSNRELSYAARFTRDEISEYIIRSLQNTEHTRISMKNTIISLGFRGSKNDDAIPAIINFLHDKDFRPCALCALVLLDTKKYAPYIVDELSDNSALVADELLTLLGKNHIADINMIHNEISLLLEQRYIDLLEKDDTIQLENFMGNLQMLWSKSIYKLISRKLLQFIVSSLSSNRLNTLISSRACSVSAINILEHYGEQSSIFADILDSPIHLIGVKEYANKILRSKRITAPR